MIATMALAVMVILLSSCSGSDDIFHEATTDGDYSFTLYLSLGDNNAVSRSTPTDGKHNGESGYDSGEGYENYIDVENKDYRLYLFDANNKLIHAVPESDMNMLPTPTLSTNGSKTYELSFQVAKTQIEEAGLNPDKCVFKLLMLANWHQYPTIEKRASITQLMTSAEARREYKIPAAATLTADDRIPVFGINQFGVIRLDPEWRTQLGTIHLLRAYSKIEVYDSETTTTPISEVTLTRYNRYSYCGPLLNEWFESEYVTNSYRNDYGALSFRPVTEASAEATDLYFKPDPVSGHFIAYVPEYRNLINGVVRPENDRARLRVSYTDNAVYHIDFKYYDKKSAAVNGANVGDYFDIRRNYLYRYELNKGTIITSMIVDVEPYVSVTLNPDFGFDDYIAPDTIKNPRPPIVIEP